MTVYPCVWCCNVFPKRSTLIVAHNHVLLSRRPAATQDADFSTRIAAVPEGFLSHPTRRGKASVVHEHVSWPVDLATGTADFSSCGRQSTLQMLISSL